MMEEEAFYLWLKKSARILSIFYDFIIVLISAVRDKVVNFTKAKSSSKILDVGTGTGKQAFAFAKRGHEVIGIDFSEDMLKVANKKNKYINVKFALADATTLPFDDDSFDVSCASFTLHDMLSTIRERAIKELARVTKPTGIVVIVDYALPKKRINKFLIYHFVKLWEKYYPEFIKTNLEVLLNKYNIKIKEELPILRGAGRILKGIKISEGPLEKAS